MSKTAVYSPTNPFSPPPYHSAMNIPTHYTPSSRKTTRSSEFVSPLSQIGNKQKQRRSVPRSYSDDNAFVSPLSKISYEPKASRSKTVKQRRRVPPSDMIDLLDDTSLGLGHYHHEGPFDATLASRQIPGRAPVDALKYSNEQALAATPRANIVDSLTKKVPLQGTGMVPPGMVGPGGQRFNYKEENINQIEGNLGRWGGINYRDEDLKGKGEPCYSFEQREKYMNSSNSSVRSSAPSDGSYYPYNISNSKPESSSTGLFRGLRNKLHLRRHY